mmetsp:Transcript_15117/g.39086  ORF Transcript_15117/g.39086 Transcript_15117/m.39086 type:complete len:220 (+) Transcript_15117:621-1280(+)
MGRHPDTGGAGRAGHYGRGCHAHLGAGQPECVWPARAWRHALHAVPELHGAHPEHRVRGGYCHPELWRGHPPPCRLGVGAPAAARRVHLHPQRGGPRRHHRRFHVSVLPGRRARGRGVQAGMAHRTRTVAHSHGAAEVRTREVRQAAGGRQRCGGQPLLLDATGAAPRHLPLALNSAQPLSDRPQPRHHGHRAHAGPRRQHPARHRPVLRQPGQDLLCV